MKSLLKFIVRNQKEVSFGWGLTFLSGFGQTFLISLYVPEILKVFEISNGTFGSIYAIATVIASILMLSLGHSIDYKPVKKVTLFTVVGLILSLVLLGFSHLGIGILIAALIGLRLTGQGLMSHISLTVMSRHYDVNRGKALSTASLGYAVGEAIFPLVISTLILWYDYNTAAFASAGFLSLYLLRLYFVDLEHFNNPRKPEKTTAGAIKDKYFSLLGSRNFLIIMPTSLSLSFSITGIFFYQYVFVEEKGWSVSLYASFFTAYAVTRFVFAIFGGLWVDRFTAKKMFRFYLLPVALGLLPFALLETIWGSLIFLVFCGCSMGMSGTVKSAVLVEVFGNANLGTIRSLFTMFSVLSTALGPLVVGLLMDTGIPFQNILMAMAAGIFLVILNAQRI